MTTANDSVPANFHGFCLRCFYDLRGLPRPVCPECGRRFDPADPATYSPTPSAERLQNLLSKTATALLDGLQMINPADPAARQRMSTEFRLNLLQRENADLRLMVDLLLELLVNKDVLRSEEIEDLRLRVSEGAGHHAMTVVDDTEPPEEDLGPSPELLDLGRAVEGEDDDDGPH